MPTTTGSRTFWWQLLVAKKVAASEQLVLSNSFSWEWWRSEQEQKNLQTTFGFNKAGRKQKWWRQIRQIEEILANTKNHWKILRQHTKNMTEWWWCLSEIPLGAKSACTEIYSAPVETGIDHFQPYHRKFIGALVENYIYYNSFSSADNGLSPISMSN